MTRRTPVSRHASSSAIVPITLMLASNFGSSTERETAAWAATWTTVSGRVAAITPSSRASRRSRPGSRAFELIRSRRPVDGVVHRRLHEPPQTVDEVGDVLERARLSAVAEHRDRRAAQRLADERGDRAPVVEPHARAEGVEDAHDARVDAVGAVVRHRDG